MSEKKVIAVIVEGPSDENAIGGILKEYMNNSLALGDTLEYEILNYLENNVDCSFKASAIAAELDCTYQLIAKRARKLIERELVYVEKEDVRKYYKITEYGMNELEKRKIKN